ncbi:metal ABC transporter permease [Marinimicrococcus flavescens]|uniref:High-affinity zinc uptake system membrane protein ZnuB n=1 Tax=Marinimicrococcus flavescens TaxID=3031815 RepID=A0AAP3XSK9_9PROT|nr:metal ABC transporter permease [Marinimicrococcus flavescens]
MLDDFLLRAFLAGLCLALAAGPLGAFVVWRRMAYLGETLANAGLLGVALGLFLHLPMTLTIPAFTVLLAMLLLLVERRGVLPLDTVLGILAHGSLALGLVILAFMEQVRFDLMSYLFGDVLAISRADLALAAGTTALVAVVTGLFWRPLLSMTVHADLAAVEGIRVERMRLVLTLLLALVIAVGMRLVGILLVVSLLVIPAGAARRLARTPEAMAAMAAAIGCAAIAAGLAGSVLWDLPAGPAVVVAAAGLFAATLALAPRAR